MEFIVTNWLELTIVGLFLIGAIIYIAWLIKKNGLRGMAVKFIVRAEDIYKNGQNKEKMDYAINKLIAKIPMPFRLFITEEMIRKFIQKIFDEVKEALDYKK